MRSTAVRPPVTAEIGVSPIINTRISKCANVTTKVKTRRFLDPTSFGVRSTSGEGIRIILKTHSLMSVHIQEKVADIMQLRNF